ncbi:hypothetical protein [Chitinophaga sp. YR573]|uniref:hypothetical protein n=1 Tax=Chitinophaga sp. YR573 TaxID=1881040 RepID=UPI00115F7CAF|nr:hypothetical protein [Chitinophaga sp. YR573]
MSEAQLRKTWSDTYCDRANPIYTFDGILVQFYSEMFDHAFYESANRKMKDKSVLSLNRCEKIHWIKDALQDPDSVLKKGWDTKTKSYDGNRRVAVVKGNYVVVINIISEAVARFITAYQIDDDENLNKLLSGPDYDRAKK